MPAKAGSRQARAPDGRSSAQRASPIRSRSPAGMERSEDDRIAALTEARAAVGKQVDRFGSMPVLGFSKVLFAIGVLKSYLSVYIAGRWPGSYWRWHALQFVLMAPLQAYRWHKMKGLAYFAEFCWVSSASTVGYLALMEFRPDLVSAEFKSAMTQLIFAFGSGPLGFAVMLLGNALVPHNIDYSMSLMIHLQPLITAHTLRWNDADRTLFPIDTTSTFSEYMHFPMMFLGVYGVLHTLFFITLGLALPGKGFMTTYDYNMNPKRGKDNIFTALFGKVGSGGSETLRFLKYQVAALLGNAVLMSATYLLWNRRRAAVHFGFMAVACLASVWNGASWYEMHLRRFTGVIDALMAESPRAASPASSPRGYGTFAGS
eukprot:TRINITY_DN13518_c0_g1_i1.p1 TRINITY_DN13518_c0_g1~~TRINITY_DN13518_c0_g1_i1.p1  ORF type:complete len:389 (+),score=84.35 TRINITY_DN13518_c0_g1_i1:48-1169(+)